MSLNSLHRNTFLILSNAVNTAAKEAGEECMNKAANIVQTYAVSQQEDPNERKS